MTTTLAPPPLDIEALDASGVLTAAVERISRERLALVSSFGPEDQVILDLLVRIDPEPRVITLDTGRLPQETYDVMDATRRRYAIDIEVYLPEAERVESMVRTKGLNLFYESIENRRECCGVRKVEPLRRALSTVDGWITGLRRDQIVTRASTPKMAPDDDHGGIWKIAPLADWTLDEVWAYIRQETLPYNALHDRGYPSIGCAPCTRAVEPGDDARAGRWWWEEPEARECGLHFDPLSGRLLPIVPAKERVEVGSQASSF